VIRRYRHWTQSWVRWIHSTLSHYISLQAILILLSYFCLGLPYFLQVYVPKFCLHFISLPSATAPPISPCLSRYFWQHLARSTNCDALSCNCVHTAVTSSLLQIFSSAFCSQTTSVYLRPLMWEIKFHSNIKQQTKLYLWSRNRNLTHHLGKSRDRYASFTHDIFLSRYMQSVVSGQKQDGGVTPGGLTMITMVFSS
jgi:hypothetical protein